MKISVRLFARAKDLAQAETIVIDVPSGATVGDLRHCMAQTCPALAGILKRSAWAVNDEFASDDRTVPMGAEVALLPPVSGG
jgi:molybdopterin converting factor subunit 1